MQQRVEHEFSGDDNQIFITLSDGLYRFSIMIGVVGLTLVALGIAAIVTGGYGAPLSGPAIIALGLIAMLGGVMFMRPRVSLDRITYTRGRDVTKLMDAMMYLDRAHGVFQVLLLAFVVVRLISFLAGQFG